MLQRAALPIPKLLAGRANYISPVLECEATIFQAPSIFWRSRVVLPITVVLEVGNVIVHQVRARATSGFRSFPWMRVGWMNPIATRSGYPLMYESWSCCQPLNCSESTTTNNSGDFKETSSER